MENFLGSLVSSVRPSVPCWCRGVRQDPVKVIRVTETFGQTDQTKIITETHPKNLSISLYFRPLRKKEKNCFSFLVNILKENKGKKGPNDP